MLHSQSLDFLCLSENKSRNESVNKLYPNKGQVDPCQMSLFPDPSYHERLGTEFEALIKVNWKIFWSAQSRPSLPTGGPCLQCWMVMCKGDFSLSICLCHPGKNTNGCYLDALVKVYLWLNLHLYFSLSNNWRVTFFISIFLVSQWVSHCSVVLMALWGLLEGVRHPKSAAKAIFEHTFCHTLPSKQLCESMWIASDHTSLAYILSSNVFLTR